MPPLSDAFASDETALMTDWDTLAIVRGGVTIQEFNGFIREVQSHETQHGEDTPSNAKILETGAVLQDGDQVRTASGEMFRVAKTRIRDDFPHNTYYLTKRGKLGGQP